VENINEEMKTRKREEFFWHTDYGALSEILGWVLLVVSLLYIIFVLSVAIGAV